MKKILTYIVKIRVEQKRTSQIQKGSYFFKIISSNYLFFYFNFFQLNSTKSLKNSSSMSKHIKLFDALIIFIDNLLFSIFKIFNVYFLFLSKFINFALLKILNNDIFSNLFLCVLRVNWTRRVNSRESLGAFGSSYAITRLLFILAVRDFWMFLMAAVLATEASPSTLASDIWANERLEASWERSSSSEMKSYWLAAMVAIRQANFISF